MRIKYTVLVFLLGLFLYSCTNNDKKINGHLVRVNNNMVTSYNADSSLGLIRTVPIGGVCKFYPNGIIKSVFSLKDGKKVITDIVHFDSNGEVKEIQGFDEGQPSASLYFNKNYLVEAEPHISTIANASTFITIDPDKDTISLGDTFTARIVVNFPLKDHHCFIFEADDNSDAYIIARGPEAILKRVPPTAGEHRFDIEVRQLKFVSVGKTVDTLVANCKIHAIGKYYVKPK